MSPDDAGEAAELRRLLREASDSEKNAHMKLELALRTGQDLQAALSRAIQRQNDVLTHLNRLWKVLVTLEACLGPTPDAQALSQLRLAQHFLDLSITQQEVEHG